MRYKLSDKNFYNGKPNGLYDFYVSEEKINESRKNVYEYLIERYNCMFLIKINDKEAAINPPTLFSKKENKDTLSKKWIAIRQANEEFKTIDKLNDNYDGQKIIERCRENIKLFHKNRGIETR